MVRYCSVPQCSTYCTEAGVSFHYYPENAVARKKWLARLRNDKKPSKYAMVCSKHFTDDAFVAVTKNGEVCKRRKLKTNAEPTLNLPQRRFDRPKLPRKAPVYRAPILNQLTRLVNSVSSSAEAIQEPSNPKEPGSSLKDALAIGGDDADNCSALYGEDTTIEVPPEDVLQMFASVVCQHAGTLRDACIQVNPQPEIGRSKPLLSYSLVEEESKIRTLTGLGCLQLMQNIISEFTALRTICVPRGFAISDEDVVLMVFVKLYHNINFSFLGLLFSVHRTTAASILKISICILARVVAEAVFFPSKESILENLTIYFQQYKHTRVVLDCTEVALERPKDLTSRLLTYSHYKKTYTVKVLIGCAPSGMITLVGTGYGGRASDAQLTARSDVLNKCMPHVDHVMVDKGFLIENLCEDARISMDRPPFLKKRRQMEKHEALRNQAIARARVHVERAIQRLKVYKILQQKFPLQLLPVFDKVVLLLAGVVNLSRPILAEDKFLPNS